MDAFLKDSIINPWKLYLAISFGPLNRSPLSHWSSCEASFPLVAGRAVCYFGEQSRVLCASVTIPTLLIHSYIAILTRVISTLMPLVQYISIYKIKVIITIYVGALRWAPNIYWRPTWCLSHFWTGGSSMSDIILCCMYPHLFVHRAWFDIYLKYLLNHKSSADGTWNEKFIAYYVRSSKPIQTLFIF